MSDLMRNTAIQKMSEREQFVPGFRFDYAHCDISTGVFFKVFFLMEIIGKIQNSSENELLSFKSYIIPLWPSTTRYVFFCLIYTYFKHLDFILCAKYGQITVFTHKRSLNPNVPKLCTHTKGNN